MKHIVGNYKVAVDEHNNISDHSRANGDIDEIVSATTK